MEFVVSEEGLTDVVGRPLPQTAAKARPVLHDVDRAWLAASPFCLVATANADGSCDVSPKGDPPGFVRVLDDRTIVIPERVGNRRVDGFRNILTNPHVGLLHVIPGRDDTLRINGSARIVRNAPFMDDMTIAGRRPQLALLVDVEEVFYHCSRAFLRSAFWSGDFSRGGAVPSRAEIAAVLDQPFLPLSAAEGLQGPPESVLY
jgi:PPOX class probable FMN-dependent enzyme